MASPREPARDSMLEKRVREQARERRVCVLPPPLRCSPARHLHMLQSRSEEREKERRIFRGRNRTSNRVRAD